MNGDSAAKPTVSVIMNCRNSARFLREAIDSVYSQTFSDWEIVFWDNLSTDDSPSIAKSYDQRLRYLRGATPLRLGAARQRALEACRGEFVALLDCDDFWAPDKLSLQLPLIRAHQNVGLVYSDSYVLDQTSGVKMLFSTGRRPATNNVRQELLVRRSFICCCTVLLRTSAVEAVGGFNTALAYCEEYELFLRVLRDYSTAYVDSPLSTFRLHGSNATGTGSVGTTIEAIQVVKHAMKDGPRRGLISTAKIRWRLLELYGKLIAQRLQGNMA